MKKKNPTYASIFGPFFIHSKRNSLNPNLKKYEQKSVQIYLNLIIFQRILVLKMFIKMNLR
jgi:hypothetical protein